ncbi:xanthine dehydrogenase-like isoform X2 [Anthonomus grandis grandis]|uniref:xanthine dehydrogenase-like isoform X2 n=1 Tax=Anthonomus grandis grandis TaxID=2921223 RepID=UPI002166A1AC|nr:xanthine dehydrogenase-like isoform X2 [Anthonomus grandis grandis]
MYPLMVLIIDFNKSDLWHLKRFVFYLDLQVRLCGTKLGCGEGGCGACTVMVSKFDRVKKKEIHIPVNACLAPICSMHGLAVTTVEGIGSTRTKLHPVQERIAKAHGSQCGFCTPGMVMSMYTMLRQSPKPTMHELEEAFQGNLCRCTGYRPILEGFKTFTEEWEVVRNGRLVNGVNGTNGTNGSCGMGEQCCKVQKNGLPKEDKCNDERLFKKEEFSRYHPSQEPIFPPELKLKDKYDKQYLLIKGPNVTWHRPTSYEQLLDLKCTHPDAKIVIGNSEIGVETKFKRMLYPVIIQPSAIKELLSIEENLEGIRVGAAVTLTDMRDFLKQQIQKHPESKTRIFRAIVDMLWWFAGKQIRSVGSIGGNIMTGSPISDMLPILMATKVKLEVMHKKSGLRSVMLDGKFFTGYRKTILNPDEVLQAIHIPFSTPTQYFKAYKQARRREDDIAIVNCATNVTFRENTNVISKISFGFGGMSFKTVNAPQTEQFLVGKPWTRETLEESYAYLLEDLPLDPSAPGGMIQYRKSLVLSLFTKEFLAISEQLQQGTLDPREMSGAEAIQEFEQKSSQYFTVVPDTQEKYDAVARPLVHTSAFKQATGEAVYCDDIPFFENELYLAFVTSTKAHAKVLSIDPSEALKVTGVEGFVGIEDVGVDRNVWGSVIHDEKVFYFDKVTAHGQIIAALVAKDQNTAQRAARLVKVQYEDLQPVITSIEDAIEHKSYFRDPFKTIVHGEGLEEVFKNAPHIISGQCRMGGQEQFYFETQGLVAVPKKEDDEMEIFSSTQNPTEVQHLIAHVLGTNQNKITCKVKRLGGGFGGKETKAAMIALPTAVAAKKFNRPIRVMLDRDEDMVMTGGRHPMLAKYKVAFDDNGKILGCEVEIYTNGGYSYDLSMGVTERALAHFENAYHIPVCKATGWICKTNLASNTAYRGFGGPQGMFIAESMAQEIAEYLKIDMVKVSEINLYRTGQLTPYNQPLENCTIDKCWKQCLTTSEFFKRRKEVEEYNRQNKYKKRGMSILPTKFGIAFGVTFLNQAGALVNIYADGSVLVHHGGIEMGQGVYTKMIQIASRALQIPTEKIHCSSTNTEIVPNTSPTAASTGSDLNGMAVLNACNILNERLQPYKAQNPKGKWEQWVRAAYLDRTSLSAQGFYKIPNLGHNWDTNTGNLFAYYTYGVACTEVEIDTLTGDHKVIRTDIVMDLGESLNPAIDIGQIEGAFMQGYGLFVLEELVYSPTGVLFTRGPGTYKIPGFGDIPAEFNVSLLKGASNPRAVYSSKAVGEPPLFLAASAMFAIKDAIKAARYENGISENFKIDCPCTAAKIRMACKDPIISRLTEPESGSFTPWNKTV